MRFASLLGALAASSLVAGCNVGSDKTVTGSLDNQIFSYHCSLTGSLEDPYCDAQLASPAFPTIALGASFFIGVADKGGSDHGGADTTDPARIARDPGSSGDYTTFIAQAPG